MPRLDDGPTESDKSHGSGSVKIAVDPMGNDQQLRFRWDGHINHISQILSQQRNESKYCDCTLVSEDGYVLRAHQAILSAASGYFQRVLGEVGKDQHPTIVLRGANFREMSCILDYIYKGQTQVSLRLMGAVMEVASMLAVKGLSQKQSNHASIVKNKEDKSYTLEEIKHKEEPTLNEGESGTPRKSGGALAALDKESRLTDTSSDSDSSSSSSDDSDSDSSSSAAEGSDHPTPEGSSPKNDSGSSPKDQSNKKKRKRKHHEKGDGKDSSDSDEGAARTKMRPPAPKTDKQVMAGINKAIDNAIKSEVKTEVKAEKMESPAASPTVARQRRPWGSKAPKDPNRPKRAQSAFFYFANEGRSKIRADHPEMSVGEVSKELGRMWNELSAESKAPYEKSAKEDRTRYDDAMKTYKAGETPIKKENSASLHAPSPAAAAATATSPESNQAIKDESDDDSSDGGDGSKKESKKKHAEEEDSVKKKKYQSVSVVNCNKNVDVPDGWVRTVTMRAGGASAGKFDVYYHSPKGKKLRSRNEVEKYCGEKLLEVDISKFQFSHRSSESDCSEVYIKQPAKGDPTGESKTSEHPEGTTTMIKLEDGGSARVYIPPSTTHSTDHSDNSAASDNDEDEEEKKDESGTTGNDEGEKKKIKPQDSLKGFTKDEVRRFIKSFKKFSNPLRRLDRLAIDADLLDKPRPSLHSLGQHIINRCQEAIEDWEEKKKDKEEAEAAAKAADGQENENGDGTTPKKKIDRGPSIKISTVALNCKTLLSSLRELEVLDKVIPHVQEERNYWLLQVKKTRDPGWGIPWDIVDDSRLLRGIYEYGLGSWEQIKEDERLKLSGKMLKDEDTKPQAKHLENRVQYLLKLLHKQETQGDEEGEKANKTPVKLKKAKEIKQEVEEEPEKPPCSAEYVESEEESSDNEKERSRNMSVSSEGDKSKDVDGKSRDLDDQKKHKDKYKDRDGHKTSKKDKDRDRERDSKKKRKRERKEKERDERRIAMNEKYRNRNLPASKQPKFESFHKMDSFKIPKAKDEIIRAPATFIDKSKIREKYGGSSDIARLGGALNSLEREKPVDVDFSKFKTLGKAHLYFKKDKPNPPQAPKSPEVTTQLASTDTNKLQEKIIEEKKVAEKPKKSLEEYKKMLSQKSSSPKSGDTKSTPLPDSPNGPNKSVGNNSHSGMKHSPSHNSSKQNYSNGPHKPSDMNSKSIENRRSSDKNSIDYKSPNKSGSPDRGSKYTDGRNQHSQERHDSHRDKYRSPNGRSPDRKYHSRSPDRHYKSDRNHHSPHRRPRSPDRSHRSPDRRRSPGNKHNRSPDRSHRSPDRYNRSPERRYRSPDRRRSPDGYKNSKDHHRRTPERRHHSSKSPHRSPIRRPPSPDSNKRPKSPKPRSPKEPEDSAPQNTKVRSRPPSPDSAPKQKGDDRDEISQIMLSDIDSDDSLEGSEKDDKHGHASDSEHNESDHVTKSDDEKMEESDHENDQQNSDNENNASDDSSDDDETDNEQRNSDHTDNEQENNDNDHSDDDEENTGEYYEDRTNSEQQINYTDVKIEHESENEEMDTSQDFGEDEATLLQGMTVPITMEEFDNEFN